MRSVITFQSHSDHRRNPFLLLLAGLVFLSFPCRAQLPELKTPQVTPSSPEAAALSRYIKYPVNLSNSLVSIPLYEITDGDIRVPIVLSYHASGLKPNMRSACHSQEKRNEMSKSENQKNSISLKFYPTGVIDDVRYSISVINDSLIVKNYFPININDKREYITQLSNNQINKIDTLISAIKIQYRNTDISEDTWGITLIINNRVVYEVGDFSFKLPPDEVKNLINYLVSLSAIKIDLYGFS